MDNISVFLEKSGTIPKLLETIDEALKTQPKALTLLVATGNKFSKTILDPLLEKLTIPVSGGIFPKVIYEQNLLDVGSVVIAWHNEVTITNYKNIENTDFIKDLVGTSIPAQKNNNDIGEYLIFIDGTVARLEENLDALYKKNGFRATFVGGGAGSASFEPAPCIISNDGLLQNAMQTVATNHKSRTTVTHGFKKQSGPHLVTSADRTMIYSLDYEPIHALYKSHHKKYAATKLREKKGFSNVCSKYPIGIEKLDGELIIRDPINSTEDSIQYFGNIPEYSKVHILSGTPDSSRDEIDQELKRLKLRREKNIDATFIFSCAHRDDMNEKGCSKELSMINSHLAGSKHIIGALSWGEIATGESRLLQLHSKTVVISRLTGAA